MTITLFICFVHIVYMDDIKKLKQIFSALDNEKRLKIVKLCSEKGHTVTELSILLKLNYSITVEYTGMLEKANLVKKTRNNDKTVTVNSLVKISDNGEISRV